MRAEALEDDEEAARPVTAAVNLIGLTQDSIRADWWAADQQDLLFQT